MLAFILFIPNFLGVLPFIGFHFCALAREQIALVYRGNTPNIGLKERATTSTSKSFREVTLLEILARPYTCMKLDCKGKP